MFLEGRKHRPSYKVPRPTRPRDDVPARRILHSSSNAPNIPRIQQSFQPPAPLLLHLSHPSFSPDRTCPCPSSSPSPSSLAHSRQVDQPPHDPLRNLFLHKYPRRLFGFQTQEPCSVQASTVAKVPSHYTIYEPSGERRGRDVGVPAFAGKWMGG